MTIPLPASKATGQKGVWVKVPKSSPYGAVLEIQATALSATIQIDGTLADDPNVTAPPGTPVGVFFDPIAQSDITQLTAPGLYPLLQPCPPKWVRSNFTAYTSDTGLLIRMKTVAP